MFVTLFQLSLYHFIGLEIYLYSFGAHSKSVLCPQTKEPGMQKKAYRVLEEMCGGEADACRSFVVENLETLKVVLLETLKNASSPAKRVRLPLWMSKSDKNREYIGAAPLLRDTF